ncbi:MAG: glycyl-radical enzyme activating protein, partial [Victivallales bacterium]|nr:glycyl-radical enzyme activating protein [Victivallales bacterium]
CGLCAESCPTDALKLLGRRMSVDEVMRDVMKDQVFYEHSGGGITLSGGEPLAHFDFSSSLLRAAKAAGLHTAVETSGFASWEHIQALIPMVDLWLWDVKTIPEKHEKLTGMPAELILDNLKNLDQARASIILRCPLIPGVNDSDAELMHIAALANECSHVQRIDLEPYHPLGEGKSQKLGRNNIFHSGFASETEKTRWLKTISSYTRTRVMYASGS